MDLSLLLSRTAAVREPVFTGEWATVFFRPDLASQQDFVIGVAAVIKGDERPLLRWLPAFNKLSSLYGDALSGTDLRDLVKGIENAIGASFREGLSKAATGTPHVRMVSCGYLATDHVEKELTSLLKRQAGALWVDVAPRESPMDDDWAYMEMRKALASLSRKIFVPNRELTIGARKLHVGLDNGKSFGNILSARYSSMQTVERHVYKSLKDVLVAHNLTHRHAAPPALFVVLPDPETPVEMAIAKKTGQLLEEVQDMGVVSYSDTRPDALAGQLEGWLITNR
ncbi:MULTISPECIES: hypothetical protein [Cupriavidus]|uniref:DUF3037 domain-containing protein n=4 Tax=Cupriavidus TaxID=106589 RepID=A0A375F6L8_9BURK|nr:MULTISPECIES: hypothetical protein [Cupriavidus]MCO4865696.1 hypothetical protein [Cupriavidus sp. WGlv3]MCO4893436.1 hypothetical protein [Cupriavidus sp. WGtm5]CAP63818.1 conserved hypothetical protein [Cupriavidus taiwanensis LMG 19424]SOY76860.1 conserved hypothetical protein [Cupriavidus taiwanensis]SOY76958.1 conserved hypothetical protein [Cupriavidus taiwanensis]